SQAKKVDNERFRLFPPCHAQFHPIALGQGAGSLCKVAVRRYSPDTTAPEPACGFGYLIANASPYGDVSMLISPAYAQAAGGDGGAGMLMQLLPLLLIFVVFYFLLIRPQQKKAKQHREMIAALRRGDRVVTAGGIVGTIVKVDDDSYATLEIAPDVRVKVMRHTITDKVAATEPASSRRKAAKDVVEDADETVETDKTEK
ncbi:preprotein translocase subunit YajC, partial [Tistrella bauzanensis]